MFAARRTEVQRIEIKPGSREELGLFFIRYAKELCVRQCWRWNTFFPKPNPNPVSEDELWSDIFFLRALEWILRHELAHIALGHLNSPWSPDQSRAVVNGADRYASQSLKGNLVRDAGRHSGAKPSPEELELDRRGLAAGVGLLWVGVYE